MGNRKQPFGYKMEFGEIVPQPQEAETVRSIYLQYLAGASFKQLAERLQTEDVPYDGDKPWNKNMVARILEDDRYIGEKHFPVLIPTEQFHAAKTGSLLWSENIVEINKQISDIASQERLLTQLKQQGSVDPDIFISRGNLLAERRRELKLQKERILRSEEDHTIQQTQDMLDVLESGPDWLDAFDEQLFSDLVEKIEVINNEKLCFRLLNGLEVTEKIERTRR